MKICYAELINTQFTFTSVANVFCIFAFDGVRVITGPFCVLVIIYTSRIILGHYLLDTYPLVTYPWSYTPWSHTNHLFPKYLINIK